MISDYMMKRIRAKKDEVKVIAESLEMSFEMAAILFLLTTLGETDMKLYKIFNKELSAYSAETYKGGGER